MSGVVARKAKAVRTLPQQMVKAGVKATQKPILDSYKRDAGSDLKLSGVPGAWRFKVQTSVRGNGLNRVVRGRARIRPAGPASWLNFGTKPHGGHPGTRAKGTFDRALPEALTAARREVKRVFHNAMG